MAKMIRMTINLTTVKQTTSRETCNQSWNSFTLTLGGWESAEREVLELYGIMTEGEYCSTLREKGFEIETSYQYLQPGYKEHLDPFVELVSEYGHEIDYPSSNMIIVAEKV